VRVDLAELAPEAQVDFWNAVTPGTYSLRSRHGAATPLDVAAEVRHVGSLLLTRFESRPHVVARTGRNVRHRPAPFVKLRLVLRGEARLYDAEGTALQRLAPGAAYLVDHARPWIADYDDQAQLNVFLRHTDIGFDPTRHAMCTSWPIDRPIGRILADAVRAFADGAGSGTEQDHTALAKGLTGLVRGLLQGGASSEAEPALRRARQASMRRYIDRHLADPELGIDSLCGAFGAARATIYRDFAAEGGVERYIVARRLARAFEELSHHPGGRGIVRAVAERWGFGSTSHFSHAFTQRFGIRPGSAVGLAAGPEPAAEDGGEPRSLIPDLEALRARLVALYRPFTG
jgi:AraC-like DNA-binding protein